VVLQAAVGAPAAPWHSRTVTVADPPLGVMTLATVTSQMRPRPPELSRPLLHVVVVATVAAEAGPVESTDPAASADAASKADRKKESGRRMSTPSRGRASMPMRSAAAARAFDYGGGSAGVNRTFGGPHHP
jgi:hypothetical protein